MRITKSVIFILLLIPRKSDSLECSSSDQFWCGDTCMSFTSICSCDNRNVTPSLDESCCPTTEEHCFKGKPRRK